MSREEETVTYMVRKLCKDSIGNVFLNVTRGVPAYRIFVAIALHVAGKISHARILASHAIVSPTRVCRICVKQQKPGSGLDLLLSSNVE